MKSRLWTSAELGAAILVTACLAPASEALASPGDAVLEFTCRGKRVSVEPRGEEVDVSIDGERVSESSIQALGDRTVYRNRQGDVAFVLELDPETGEVTALRVLPPAQVPAGMPKTRIGVNLAEIGEALAAQLPIEADEGLLISGVAEDMPADEAGLAVNDVIVGFDGEAPITRERLHAILDRHEPGDRVRIEYLRKGKRRTAELELDSSVSLPERLSALDTTRSLLGGYGLNHQGNLLLWGDRLGKHRLGWPNTALEDANRMMLDARTLQKQYDQALQGMKWPSMYGPYLRWRGGEDDSDEDEGDLDQRLKDIEEDLRRLERMLQKLVDGVR